MINWLNSYGVVKDQYESKFQEIVKKLVPIFKELEGQMTYRDLYDLAMQMAHSAVGELVRTRVNEREAQRSKKRRKKRDKK